MMTDDPIGTRGEGAFPVDQPMQALEKDHQFVKQLFDRYCNTQDPRVKQEAGPRILELLEMHTALEEATFYPAVSQANAALVEQCKNEHEQADQLIQQLKGMDVNDPQCDRLFQQLRDAILQHVQVEEQQLFPAVRQANLDLQAIGLQMAAFESNMAASRAQQSAQRGAARPGA
ncbi:MAG TPA: hemerythrin domain-containing protein [Noviherbaspirillum sp.]|nr:hemerythrin domain-containing protein [Noviherbaspirillum sp.]